MHKYGAGEAQYDPEDPQGVPEEDLTRTGAQEDTSQALADENNRADAGADAGQPESNEG